LNKKIVASGSHSSALPYDLDLGVVETANGWVVKLSLERILLPATRDPFRLKTSTLIFKASIRLMAPFSNRVVHE
jgi:hypothetical protein